MLSKIDEKMMVNCGSLGDTYVYNIEKKYRKFLFELDEKMNVIVKEISEILEEVLKRKSAVETDIEPQLVHMQKNLQMLGTLAEQLAGKE